MRLTALLFAGASCFCAALIFAASPHDSKPRVFVSGTDPRGGSTAADTTRQLVKACPGLIITLDEKSADFTVVRDVGPGVRPQKITVFDGRRQLIYTGQTAAVKNAAKDVCKAIQTNLKAGENQK